MKNLIEHREYADLFFYVLIIILTYAEKLTVVIVNLFWNIEIFFWTVTVKKNSGEMIDYSQQYCRKNHDDFYSLSCFLRSLIAIERGRLELESKLKKTLEKWNANIKI